MKFKNKYSDVSKTILRFTLIATAILIIIGFIPPTTIGGIKLNRVNILTFIDFQDSIVSDQTSRDILDTTSLANASLPFFPQLSDSVESDSSLAANELKNGMGHEPVADVPGTKHKEKTMSSSVASLSSAGKNDTPSFDFNHSGIEDYSKNGEMIKNFINTLVNDSKTRNVRIAFLGDSFIEGDILSCDFRRQLQSEFGGEGIGFVPFADPTSKFRPYICQETNNWTCYNLLHMKKIPPQYQKEFYVSGYVAVPQPGASATFYPRPHGLPQLSSAQIIFKNRGESEMRIIVNKSDTMNIVLEQKEEVQRIHIEEQNIQQLTVKLPKCNNFIGYGVLFSGSRGINVDNYGLRSCSGLNILSTDYKVNQQINEMLQYDMVILEYGLNALRKDIVNYDYYGTKLERIVNYIKICFPRSAILFISVGDIGMKKDNTIITAPAVEPMVNIQRRTAKNQKIAFWNLFSAMGGNNSIQRYVSNGWAAKDYLHINYRGGHEISNLLINALYEQLKYYQQPIFNNNVNNKVYGKESI